jgi:hypothetical protein
VAVTSPARSEIIHHPQKGPTGLPQGGTQRGFHLFRAESPRSNAQRDRHGTKLVAAHRVLLLGAGVVFQTWIPTC